MATTVHSVGVSATDTPSPTPSDTSLPAQQGESEAPRHRSPRPSRSPDRPLLRTAFRNFSGVATVMVGEVNSKSRPQTRYLVHKELLTAASPFFAAALNSTFAEGLDQVVRLPEEKPESFEWFLQWLYTGTLTTQSPSADIVGPGANHVQYQHIHLNSPNPPQPARPIIMTGSPNVVTLPVYPRESRDTPFDGDLRNSHGSPKYFLLLDLYALSDRLLTTPLSNHILSTIARLSESTNSVPTPSDTWILYGAIRDSAPLRALVLDLFAYKKTDRLLDTHKDDWHPRFLRDLVVKLKRPAAAPDALGRHSLVAWEPRSWSVTRACEGCRDLLRPLIPADKCIACDKSFCGECVRRLRAGEDPGHAWLGDWGGCKPWAGRGICVRYHEHPEGEACR